MSLFALITLCGICSLFLTFQSIPFANAFENHGAEKFYNLAHSFEPTTDKTVKHRYEIMYGRFLMPRVEAHKRPGARPIKFLEIGLGCNMQYGSGVR